MVQLGDKGAQVSEVQKFLSMLGYDLIVDAYFGKRTLRSLKAFQKKYNLAVDGIAGKKTLIALKAAQGKASKEINYQLPKVIYNSLTINTDYKLPPEQYNRQKTEKSQIFIHFTAGRSSAKNSIAYWNSNESKVSTAFVIDGDTGIPYEAFHPDFWGWHLGAKGTKGRLDKASIGIEICAFGPLKKRDNKYYAWPSKWNTEVPEDKVYHLDKEHRGFKYFYAYSNAQVKNLEKLLCFLIEKYNIKVQKSFDESWFEYKPELYKKTMPGIWTHVNVRKDKSDSYPDKRLIEMLNRLAKKYN